MRTPLLIATILCCALPSVGQAGPRFDADDIERAAQEMTAADSNGDGMIARAEFSVWRRSQFDRLDRNSDGYVSDKDMRSSQQAKARLTQALAIYDTNRDGRISRTEFTQGPTPGFDQVDRNGNDVVDSHELKLARGG